MDAIITPPTQSMPLHLDHQRRDERCCEIINKGISVQSCFSTLCAIEYLKSNNVHPEIIERVLLNPDQRRKLTH
ncbi:MAG: hypothetical protein V4724_03570 [Pseudomonadota bacterium]